jgi:hypothetical protein
LIAQFDVVPNCSHDWAKANQPENANMNESHEKVSARMPGRTKPSKLIVTALLVVGIDGQGG